VAQVDQTKDNKKNAIAPPAPVTGQGAPHRNETAMPTGGGRVDKSPSLLSPQGQAEAEYRRAQGLLAQGSLEEAEMALSQTLRLVPEHANARQALFALLVEQGRKDEAKGVLEAGLAILPGHSTWAMNIARLQMEKNDAVGAWETLQRSLGSAQNNGEYRAFCGTVLQRLGRPKDAIEHFHAALRINPGEGRWWLGLALVLESAGHPAEAREAYARAKGVGNLPADLAAFAEQKSRQP
jgi:MSHA biogenesis protein MshN